jgi:catechol 2,3-dioxygenase
MSERLAADTSMGAVTLVVADLDLMTRYYSDGVGLAVLDESAGRVVLGRDGVAVIVLQHSPGLRHTSPGEAGLYHTAIVFENQAALAASVYSVARAFGRFTGSSDHLVSQAFYFDDPEGNGVELYWDRDRSAWSWVHGQVEMGVMRLDPNAFLSGHLTEEGAMGPVSGGERVGHVHLSVGDVATAREFYVNRLGFEQTLDYGESALFVSAGGYHHHMAMNVWNSQGAGRRQPALGLGRIDILVPGADDLGELGERLRHYGHELRDDGRSVELDDPWANLLRITTPQRG